MKSVATAVVIGATGNVGKSAVYAFVKVQRRDGIWRLPDDNTCVCNKTKRLDIGCMRWEGTLPN